MAMFDNKKTMIGGVFYSRLIVSWLNAGGLIYDYGPLDEIGFKRWLRENCSCSESEVKDIYELATNGKREYEDDASRFLASEEYMKNKDEVRKNWLRKVYGDRYDPDKRI